MTTTQRDGVDLYFEQAGNPNGPPVLLIPGLGMQLIDWTPRFVETLGQQYRLILIDNRDSGFSTVLHGAPHDGSAVMDALMAGTEPPLAYDLHDMAADAAAVIEAVGLESTHVVGISMGGMIAQCMAIALGPKLRSLTSIMSTTGAPDVGQPSPAALEAVLSPVPENTRESTIAHGVETMKVWATPGHYDAAMTAEGLGASWDRVGGTQAEGVARQVCAIMASPARDADLASVSAPTLVIHGTADQLVNPSGGVRTAECIPGATLRLIDGMGHDLGHGLVGGVLDAIVDHINAVEADSAR